MDIISEGRTLVLHGAFDVRSTREVRAAIYERLDAHPRLGVPRASNTTTPSRVVSTMRR